MNNSSILIIEDDPIIGPGLKDFLKKKFAVFLIKDGNNIEKLNLFSFDLVVLDLILPGTPGEKILEWIKIKRPSLPVLVLTARYSISSKEKCFKIGADDYLTKPFEPLELELRIMALLRRFKRDSLIHLGDLSIDVKKRLIYKNGKELFISGRTWSLLNYFLQNKDKIISKSEIIENVWADAVVSEDSIRTYIKELRKILSKERIVTYKGRGYRLVG